MNYIETTLKRNRTVGNYLFIGCGLYMLILSFIYLAIDPGALKITDYSKTLTFSMLLVGSLLCLSTLFYHSRIISRIMPFVVTILYAIGLGRQLYLVAYPLADLATGVNWFGGSLALYLSMFILIALGTIVSIVSCFFKQEKDER